MSGTKNTTDPRASDPIRENPGAIASDSLAADSSRAGGAFSENTNSTPGGVSGASSTLANTDTSAATTLEPAKDANERENNAEASNKTQSKSSGGVATGSSGSGGGSGGGESGSSNAGAAPSYVSNVAQERSGGPKGANLTEGGFEGEAKNNDFEIGSENDPGRASLGNFQARNADVAGGGGPRQGEITGDGQFDALRDEEA